MKVVENQMSGTVESAENRTCRCRNCACCDDNHSDQRCRRFAKNTEMNGRSVTASFEISVRLGGHLFCSATLG